MAGEAETQGCVGTAGRVVLALLALKVEALNRRSGFGPA
jgi:hypothetical protein